MLRWPFLLLLLVGPTGSARAQLPPTPEALLRTWLTAQRDAARELTYGAFTEEVRWTVDGPFGKRETDLYARVEGVPGTNEWTRQIRALSANGHPVPKERWDGFEHRMHRLFGRNAILIAPGLPSTTRLLTRTRPASGVTDDVLGTEPAWRLEVIPLDHAGPVERITLWFSQATGALQRTRTIFQSRGSTLVATVDYERQGSLDLPHTRQIEGTIQTRRRGQSFTLLFTLDATYSEYDLTFAEQ